MRRRQLLAALGAGAVPLAGCLGVVRPPVAEGTGDGSSGGSEPSVTHTATISTDCGGPGDDWVRADRDAETVWIEGVCPAPNPCHEAVVGETTLEDGVLSVAVDVASTLGEDEDCIQCHGAVAYELSIEVGSDPVNTVRVSHQHGDTHDVTPADDDQVELQTVEIETLETDCSRRDGDRAELREVAEDLVIEGVRPAPTPCYLATVEDSSLHDGALTLQVGLESDLAEDGVCIECLGAVRYRLVVGVSAPRAVEEVTVDHLDAGTHVLQVEND